MFSAEYFFYLCGFLVLVLVQFLFPLLILLAGIVVLTYPCRKIAKNLVESLFKRQGVLRGDGLERPAKVAKDYSLNEARNGSTSEAPLSLVVTAFSQK